MKKVWIIPAICLALATSCSQSGSESANEATDNTEMDETAQDQTASNDDVPDNTLTDAEKADGWMLLFDGESSEGWRGYGKEEFPSDWKITDDGNLYMAGSGRGEAGSANGGDIIYGEEQFGNFHLKLQWKVSEGGNSGIFYLGQETPEYDFIWKTAPEMQILDNERHPDAMLGTDGNRKAGSLYDLYAADPQNSKPAGEWNTAEVISYKGTVVHKQNGITVVEYHLWTPQWYEDVADSKFPELNENWAEVAKEGYIGLQDHGDDVWFKNIKIKKM